MSWFTNLFSSSSKDTRSSRKAMSSTHEAFSLPTSSPSLSPHHPDAFNPHTLHASDSPTLTSPTSYSYPPQSPVGTYDYVPTSSRTRQSSILPLHNAPMSPSYPPLSHTWVRLRAWLSSEYPELGDTLNFGILPQDLQQIEMAFGFALPAPVRESYLCVDGQEPESSVGCSEGLFFGLTFLPLEDVLEEWRFWREVDDDPNTGANPRLREVMQSIPPGWVRKEYSSRGWIPLIADKAGNYVGIDMNPDRGGAVGQVIVFGRDFDTKVVMWRGDGPGGWARWLAGFVEDLESGEGFELGISNDGSEGSEDSVGYESYFYDGVGRGVGDGGGDNGGGGMRLAGEYKGWSVLEAWADRSVRRWQEAGLLPEPEMPSLDKGKVREKNIPEALILPATGAGAEVPIPVLEEDTATTPLGNATNRNPAPSKQTLPSISVTKPPIPRPVDLPTQDDMLDPSDSDHSPIREDLESGGNIIMREIEHQATTTRTAQSSSSKPLSNGVVDASLVPLPTSPVPRIITTSPEPIPSPPVDVPNFLEDPAPALPTLPIVPSAPPSHSHTPSNDEQVSQALTTVQLDDSPVLISSEDAVEKGTVRLVGSGGMSGASEDSNDGVLVSEPETEPVEAVATVLNNNPSQQKEGKHEKKKSLTSSLKRFSGLGGGKRKKDSTSSLKDIPV